MESSLKQIIWIGFLASSIRVSTFDPVSSSINIDDFLKNESDMIPKVQDYLIQERKRLDQLRIYQQEWKQWRNSYIGQESEYIGIPQNLFHLFKKFSLDFDEMENIVTGKLTKNTLVLDDIQPPTKDDFKEIVSSLIDLQYQYDLKSEDIANGTLMGLRLNTSLSSDSCFFIGKTCSENNNHRCAIDWFEACLSSSPNEEFTRKIYNLTYPSYMFLHENRKAFKHAMNYLKLDYFDSSALDIYMDLGLQLGELDDDDNSTLEAYRLCREHSTNPIRSNLKCRYNHENSYFLKIAPLKEEELSHYPKVLLYRDAIYDSEIEIIKNEATKKLRVSKLAGLNGSAKKGFVFRISETAFLDNKLPVLTHLTERVTDISDLSISASEWWQVLNYAPGGFYMMHSDYLSPDSISVQKEGNRITTMLFYFNEIIQGGETVFPRIGVSVKPAKGLAVVWHNVHSDGSKNLLADHSACPVVIGEKWGFTQWMRSFNQTCLKKIYEYEPKGSYNFTQPQTEDQETQD